MHNPCYFDNMTRTREHLQKTFFRMKQIRNVVNLGFSRICMIHSNIFRVFIFCLNDLRYIGMSLMLPLGLTLLRYYYVSEYIFLCLFNIIPNFRHKWSTRNEFYIIILGLAYFQYIRVISRSWEFSFFADGFLVL